MASSLFQGFRGPRGDGDGKRGGAPSRPRFSIFARASRREVKRRLGQVLGGVLPLVRFSGLWMRRSRWCTRGRAQTLLQDLVQNLVLLFPRGRLGLRRGSCIGLSRGRLVGHGPSHGLHHHEVLQIQSQVTQIYSKEREMGVSTTRTSRKHLLKEKELYVECADPSSGRSLAGRGLCFLGCLGRGPRRNSTRPLKRLWQSRHPGPRLCLTVRRGFEYVKKKFQVFFFKKIIIKKKRSNSPKEDGGIHAQGKSFISELLGS